MIFRSFFNTSPEAGEVSTGSSLTVPNQCMSIKEMLIRQVRGLPISGSNVYYDDETDFDNDEVDFDANVVDRVDIEEKIEAINIRAKRDAMRKPPIPNDGHSDEESANEASREARRGPKAPATPRHANAEGEESPDGSPTFSNKNNNPKFNPDKAPF